MAVGCAFSNSTLKAKLGKFVVRPELAVLDAATELLGELALVMDKEEAAVDSGEALLEGTTPVLGPLVMDAVGLPLPPLLRVEAGDADVELL